MYGCFDPVFVYGFSVGDRETRLSEDWIESFGISEFALDVVRGYLGEAVYGIRCSLDQETGVMHISEEHKQKVIAAHSLYLAHIGECHSSKVQFYLALYGDYNVSQHEVLFQQEGGDETE